MSLEPTITNNYSMDIIIKICITLFTFLIFLFISAWYMTRKNYKYPKIVSTETAISNLRDLVDVHFLNDCYQAGCHGDKISRVSSVSANILENKMAIVINDLDWLMENKSSFIFTVPFSMAPKSLTRVWRGLLFSRDPREKDVLLCLTVKAFESLDWRILLKALNFGLRRHRGQSNGVSVDTSALLIAFEAIFGYDVDRDNRDDGSNNSSDKWTAKLTFINRLSTLVADFSELFYSGRVTTDGDGADDLIERIEELLNPVIESAVYHCDSTYHESIAPSSTIDVCPNLLSQIAFLRHHLKEDTVNCHSNSITVDDFAHCLFEHLFILSELMRDCLRGVLSLRSSSAAGIFDAVAMEIATEAPSLACGDSDNVVAKEDSLETQLLGSGENVDAVANEDAEETPLLGTVKNKRTVMGNSNTSTLLGDIGNYGAVAKAISKIHGSPECSSTVAMDFSREEPLSRTNYSSAADAMLPGNGSKDPRTILTEFHLESSHSLVYTKATTQELMRLLCLGAQFDLSLAERDCQLGDGHDVREYSVLLFNQFAFSRSRCFGVSDRTDAEFFRPGRFVSRDPISHQYVFFNSCQLVTFQDQQNFVGIPRNFVCRMLLLMLVRMVSPGFAIDMGVVGDGSDGLGGAFTQYELLYDLPKKTQWVHPDLADD